MASLGSTAAGTGTLPQPRRATWYQSFMETVEGSRSAQLLALAIFAFLVRVAAFGEWTFDIDDQFYLLVGDQMLHGARLYVDVWDRKGPLLYILYAGFALFPKPVLAFEVGATLSVIASAYGINRLTQLVSTPRAGMIAGVGYLGLTCMFGGASGQTPVFYNTLMIGAVWAIVTNIGALREGRVNAMVVGGIACASAALAIKQSAAAEAAFFGIFISVLLLRSRSPLWRTTLQIGLLAFVALLPWLVTAAYYLAIGHFPELWNALVTSNMTRMYETPIGRVYRVLILSGRLIFLLVFGYKGAQLMLSQRSDPPVLKFFMIWAVVALLSVLTFPNIFAHYALPILPAFCILASAYFASSRFGMMAFGAMMAVALVVGGTLNPVRRYQAHVAANELVRYVDAETPSRKLFVWGMPSYLYMALDIPPPSALAFPPHLYQGDEAGVSGIDEVGEVTRILAGKPETVVVQDPILARPLNLPNIAAVNAYVKTCGKRRRILAYDHKEEAPMIIYSQCGTRTPAKH